VAPPSLPLLATSELVGISWIGSIPAIASLAGTQMVATQLPADVNPDGTEAAWLQTGFITVKVVGGSPDIYLPVKKPVFEIACWAAKPGSNKPPWWQANVIAETIRYATLQRTGFNRVLTLGANGVAYPGAVVTSAYFATEFRRLYSDSADYALYQADLAVTWQTIGDTLP
jgi:hypothetical protein